MSLQCDEHSSRAISRDYTRQAAAQGSRPVFGVPGGDDGWVGAYSLIWLHCFSCCNQHTIVVQGAPAIPVGKHCHPGAAATTPMCRGCKNRYPHPGYLIWIPKPCLPCQPPCRTCLIFPTPLSPFSSYHQAEQEECGLL